MPPEAFLRADSNRGPSPAKGSNRRAVGSVNLTPGSLCAKPPLHRQMVEKASPPACSHCPQEASQCSRLAHKGSATSSSILPRPSPASSSMSRPTGTREHMSSEVLGCQTLMTACRGHRSAATCIAHLARVAHALCRPPWPPGPALAAGPR